MEFSSALVINTLANQFVTGDILDLKIVIKNIYTHEVIAITIFRCYCFVLLFRSNSYKDQIP